MKSIIFLMLFTGLNSYAATKVTKSEVSFTAVGRPAFIKATGILPIEKADLKIESGKLSGNLIVPLTKLDSGIETRDEHLKEKYLHVDKHPMAKLTLENIDLVSIKSKSKVLGKLMLHGVEKEIPIEVEAKMEGKKLEVKADLEVILTDFSIELPSFQGITAAKNVKIEVQSTFEIE
jgi:polyisoprenoid-binding protein YceI